MANALARRNCATIEWLKEYDRCNMSEKFLLRAIELNDEQMREELSMPIIFTNTNTIHAAIFKHAELFDFELSIAVSAATLYQRLYRRLHDKTGRSKKKSMQLIVDLRFNALDIFLCLNLASKYIRDFPRVRFKNFQQELQRHYTEFYSLQFMKDRETEILGILSYKIHYVHAQQVCISLYLMARKKYPEHTIELGDDFIFTLMVAIDVFYHYSEAVHHIMKTKYDNDRNDSKWLRFLMFDSLHIGMVLTLYILEMISKKKNIPAIPEALYIDLETWSNVPRKYCLSIVGFMTLVLDKEATDESLKLVIQNYADPNFIEYKLI